jgi:hypothetical protein
VVIDLLQRREEKKRIFAVNAPRQLHLNLSNSHNLERVFSQKVLHEELFVMPVLSPEPVVGSSDTGFATGHSGAEPSVIRERSFERFDASQLKAPTSDIRPAEDRLTTKAAQKRFSRIQPDDIRSTSPIPIPLGAKVHYADQNGGNIKMDRGYRQIEFSWQQGGDSYYARWHTKEHDGLKEDRPIWRVSRRPLGRGQSYREELIGLKDGTTAFIPSSVFRQAQRFLREAKSLTESGEDINTIQKLREAAVTIIDRVHFPDQVTKPTSGTVPWQKERAA